MGLPVATNRRSRGKLEGRGRLPVLPFILITLMSGLLLSGLTGCTKTPLGPPPPVTFPVTGKVVAKPGQQIAGGVIEFSPASGAARAASGELQADGTFTLSTFAEGKRVPGAMEGTYQVTVIPPIPPDQKVEITTLPEPHTVKPGENNFMIDLSAPK